MSCNRNHGNIPFATGGTLFLVQLTQYGSQQNPVVTPASPLTQAFTQTTSPRLDVSYMNASSRTGIAPEHLFHNGHTAASPQGPFGHGMSQVAC